MTSLFVWNALTCLVLAWIWTSRVRESHRSYHLLATTFRILFSNTIILTGVWAVMMLLLQWLELGVWLHIH